MRDLIIFDNTAFVRTLAYVYICFNWPTFNCDFNPLLILKINSKKLVYKALYDENTYFMVYYVNLVDAFGVSRNLTFTFLCLTFYQCSLIASSISMFLVLSMLSRIRMLTALPLSDDLSRPAIFISYSLTFFSSVDL